LWKNSLKEVWSLTSHRSKPSLLRRKGDELSFSGPAFVELIRAVLDKGVPFRFKAKGISMHPFIRNGDVITVYPLSGTSPRYGDVVAFIRPNTSTLIVHRVVGKGDDSFLIRGDNTGYFDGLIPTTNILGYVTKVERNDREAYLGLGLERFLIAFLTRRGLLLPLLSPIRRLIRPIIKR
jgi:signal peptidase